ncbi:hypothetical protein Tco_1556416 [Tanacetum coccineum]
MQKEEDLRGDDLKHYDAEIEAMNLILISILNDIYNSVDACTTAKDMWQRVERLMRGTVQNQAKKLEKSHNPLALVAHTSSLSRTSSPYYVTHPSSVVDYDDDYPGDTSQNNSDDPLTSAMILLACAITRNFSNPTNNQKVIESKNVQNDTGNIQRTLRTASSENVANMLLAKQDEARVILTDKQNDFLFADVSRMEEIEELSANICLMDRIQPANIDGSSNASAFFSEVYLHLPVINIIFDEPNEDVNSSSVENDNNVRDLYELEQLARNAYKEAEKQQIIAKKVQQQNIMLTKQLELYKEKVRVFEITKEKTTNYFNKYIKADRKAKRFEQESQSQFIHDQDIIQNLEQQRDKLDLNVVELKRQTMKLQKTQSILKRKMSEKEDQYHDTVLNLEAKVKKNVDTVLKIGNSLQGMFMLGPKPMSFYDSQLKHSLGYANPYTLKKAISQNPKLYDASYLDDSKIHMNVRDTEDILEDATKSQIKMKNKMKDPIAIEKTQNVSTIDYNKLNALYEDFVP